MSKVNFKVKEIGELVLFTPQDEDANDWWTNNVPVGSYFSSTRKCGGYHALGKGRVRFGIYNVFGHWYAFETVCCGTFAVPIKHARKIWSDICTANGSRGWSIS